MAACRPGPVVPSSNTVAELVGPPVVTGNLAAEAARARHGLPRTGSGTP